MPEPESDDLAALAQAEEEGPSVVDEVHDTVQELLPWGISVLLHVGFVLLAIFIAWSVIVTPDEEEIIVPVVRLSETPGAPITQQTKQEVKKTSSRRRSVTTPDKATSPVPTKLPTTPVIVVQGAAAKASPFGTSVSAGSEFKASMFGAGGNARRIVFLIDASGSLIDTLPYVILELKKTIQKLSSKQSFTIIFFQGDEVIEVPPKGLSAATAEYKEQASKWIDLDSYNVEPGGKSNPVKAIQTALRYKPQLLFLLSDNITGAGQYEIDQRRLLAEIERANTSNTKINTIQFLYPDPLTEIGLAGTLEQISKTTGGVYKFISPRDLNLE